MRVCFFHTFDTAAEKRYGPDTDLRAFGALLEALGNGGERAA